jgi:hypothetical protein
VIHSGDVKSGSRIAIYVEKEGWHVQEPNDGWITIPDNPVLNPVHIVMAKNEAAVSSPEVRKLDVLNQSWKDYPCSSSSETHSKPMFYLGIVLEFRFRSNKFNTRPYLLSVGEPDGDDVFTRHSRIELTNNSVGRLFTCAALPERPAAARTFRLKLRNAEVQFRADALRWTPIPEDTFVHGRFASGKVSVVLGDPDWVVFRSARILATQIDGQDVVEGVFENLSKTIVSLNSVSLMAADQWGSACDSGHGQAPIQTVTLDWSRLASSGPVDEVGGWTDFADQKVAVRVSFRPANCSNYSNVFQAEIPVQFEVQANSVGRLTFLLSGANKVLSNATGSTAGKPLRAWQRFHLSVDNKAISPGAIEIER